MSATATVPAQRLQGLALAHGSRPTLHTVGLGDTAPVQHTHRNDPHRH